MKASEFDSRLRDILDAEEVQVDPAQWNRLAATLPGARVRISRRLVNWMRAVGWAAAVLLVAGGGYALLRNGDGPAVAVENAVPESPAATSNPTVLSNPTINIPAIPPMLAISPVAASTNNQRAFGKTAVDGTVRGRIDRVQEQMPPVELGVYEPEPASLQPIAANPVVAPRPSLASAAPNDGQVVVTEPFVPVLDAPEKPRGSSTALGLAGAYRPGGQNAGYALGVSVRQQLGRKLFLDGDVAYLGNSRTTSTSRMDGETYDRLANPDPAGGGTAGRQPLPATAAASLSYVQVAPALSYQVLPALSIGAGPDVQRIVAQAPSTADDQLVSYDQTSAPEYIPAIDWGLTGKAEYSIGNRLRAGVQYRHGFNNALRNEPGITYTERSYMQVQLRVFLLK